MLLPLLLLLSSGSGGDANKGLKDKRVQKPDENEPLGLCKNVVGVLNPQTKLSENYIFDRSLYLHKVEEIQNVKYWRAIMNLHQDTALMCFADSRNIIAKVCLKEWNTKDEHWKKLFKDSLRCTYNADKACLNFHKGINCFIDNGVDPWFAQAILLIESPNKLQKSNVGAYGSFQLMKDVARMYGLKVNKQIDERAIFERSAYAASSLLKNICIPNTLKMLDSLRICDVNQDELWFKLLVMHVYHAGSGNVQKALFSFAPTEGSMDIIYNLWKTNVGYFKTQSQNYSQLVLAAMLEMNERLDLRSKHGLAIANN
jgi:Transglycosylase SLT domain